MYDKVILDNGVMLWFIIDCYKNQKLCYNAVDNCSHALEFVPDCNKQRYVIKLLTPILLQYTLFLIDIRLVFLIDIKNV